MPTSQPERFSERWPYKVHVRPDVGFDEVYPWLLETASHLGIHTREIYTGFTTRVFAFKDKKIAMEFKLRFG